MIYGTFIKSHGELSGQLYFLSKAVSDDETRLMMSFMLIEPSDKKEGQFKGVTTDGRRLHLVDPLAYPGDMGLEPGNWAVLKAGFKETWIAKIVKHDEKYPVVFPAYKRVIPQGDPEYKTEFSGLPPLARNISSRGSQNMVKFIREFPDPTAFNLKYLADLGSFLIWDVAWYGGSKAGKFTSGDYSAVIMPMAME